MDIRYDLTFRSCITQLFCMLVCFWHCSNTFMFEFKLLVNELFVPLQKDSSFTDCLWAKKRKKSAPWFLKYVCRSIMSWFLNNVNRSVIVLVSKQVRERWLVCCSIFEHAPYGRSTFPFSFNISQELTYRLSWADESNSYLHPQELVRLVTWKKTRSLEYHFLHLEDQLFDSTSQCPQTFQKGHPSSRLPALRVNKPMPSDFSNRHHSLRIYTSKVSRL